MSVTIKMALEITVSDTALEDAMAEYDELSVEGLVKEILDKAIACDQVIARVDEGPNTWTLKHHLDLETALLRPQGCFIVGGLPAWAPGAARRPRQSAGRARAGAAIVGSPEPGR